MKRYFLGILSLLMTGVLFVSPEPAHTDGLPAVVLNEVFWMGSSLSSNDEWIELRNTSPSPIDLANWRITKFSNNVEVPMLTIPSGVIPAGGYFLIANDPAETSRLNISPQLVDASVSLVNSKLQITLYDTAGVLIDRADDGSGSPLAGDYQSGAVWKSMERNPSGSDGTQKEHWHTASTSLGFDDAEKEYGTPGSGNSNLPPVISAAIPTDGVVGETVNVDASETLDPEGDVITIQWDLGDGVIAHGATVAHAYTAAGSYQITVTVSDGMAVSTFSSTIAIAQVAESPSTPNQSVPSPESANTAPVGTPSTPEASSEFQTSKEIRLNELFPNPKGKDAAGEFIELVNEGAIPVDLRGWKITDRVHAYVFSSSLLLGPKHYLALTATETHVSLKNSGKQEWFLADPFGAIMQGVAYEGAPEGKSFSRSGNEWFWATPTLGTANEVETGEKEAASDDVESPDTEAPFIPLEAIGRRALRSDVRIRGTVIAVPGSISANYFYVSDGKTGVQIFSSKGAFPDLTPGDSVEIRGKVGEASGERKLNLQSADDILVVDTTELPDPLRYSKTLASGMLVTVDGNLTTKRGTSLLIETPDGIVTVTIPRSVILDKDEYAVGDHLTVTGLWRGTKEASRLYLLSGDDIVTTGTVKGARTESPAEAAPALASRGTQQITLDSSNTKKSAVFAILLPVVLFGLLGAYLWRKRRNAGMIE